MVNEFVAKWAQTAKNLKLTTVFSPDEGEIVIFNGDHPDWGFMWIKAPHEVTFCDYQGNTSELAPGFPRFDALGKLGAWATRH